MTNTKKDALLKRVHERRDRERPNLVRLDAEAPAKGYRAFSLSLYMPQMAYVDRLTTLLRSHRVYRANRSLVVQELILIGQEQLGDIPEDVLVSRLQERIAKRRERRA